MTKRDIVQTIAGESGLQQLQARQIVQKTFDAILQTLKDLKLSYPAVTEEHKQALLQAREILEKEE